jgi:glycosyltransferase involved in cell wall biosynthesis
MRGSGLVAASGSFEQVRWLGLRRDLPALLDAADGFVLASAWEGMPLVVGEAMAMERPVVATDVGGVRELVGDAGVLVPASDSEALANAMASLMERSAEDRRRLGRAARNRIESQFSMNARADEWDDLYQDVLNSTE